MICIIINIILVDHHKNHDTEACKFIQCKMHLASNIGILLWISQIFIHMYMHAARSIITKWSGIIVSMVVHLMLHGFVAYINYHHICALLNVLDRLFGIVHTCMCFIIVAIIWNSVPHEILSVCYRPSSRHILYKFLCL